jgi:acyl dehydratase
MIIPIADVDRHVGTELGISEWRPIAQPDIQAFADLTGDHQWVHVDVERAQRELGGTIVHGYFTLSFIPVLTAEIMRLDGVAHGLNYGLDSVRFLAPVPAGSRIRARESLVSAEKKGEGRLLKFEVTIEIEGADRPACVARTLVLVYPASAAS